MNVRVVSRTKHFVFVNVRFEFKRSYIKRYSLPPKRSRMNQKTPERMTIEKPLYFCSRQFVGQFARVMRAAVSSSAAREITWIRAPPLPLSFASDMPRILHTIP